MTTCNKGQTCTSAPEPSTAKTCGNCAEATAINGTWIRCEARSVEEKGVYSYQETHPAWLPGCGIWKEKQ